MKFFIALLFAITVTSISFSQSGKLKKADDYYSKLSYSLAAQLYEDLLASPIVNADMKAKLAFCYYNQNQLENASKMFAEAVKSGEIATDYYFYYAQALKQLGNYSQSNSYMQTFYDKKKSDKRAISYAQNKSYLETIEKEGIHFTINNEKYNSSEVDFGSYQHAKSNQHYFVSSRKKALIQNYWSWNGNRFLDLYTVKKENGRPSYFSVSVNTKFHEGPLCFSKDESVVFFTRNNLDKGKNRRDDKGIQNLKLYKADVESSGKWKNVQELSLNSKEYSVGHPALSPDGNYLYFVSDMPGGFGGADIYRSKINPDGTIGNPSNLGASINTEGQEMFPWLSADGLLFFSSNGHIGLGGLDVFVCTVESDGKFANLTNAGKPLNSQRDDFGFNFNQDGLTGHFSSNREGGKGSDDIYSFEMTRPFVFKVLLTGRALDKDNNTALAGSEIVLKDKSGKIVATTIADKEGNYSFQVEPNSSFTLHAKQVDYTETSVNIEVPKDSPRNVKTDVLLVKVPKIALIGSVRDNKTGETIGDVNVKITNALTGAVVFEGKTGKSGDFLQALDNAKLNDQLNYTVSLSKNGYLSKSVDFKHTIDKAGFININNTLDLSLGKVEVGVDLASLIDIKPIYFDRNKFVIRADAAKELDKIIKIMNEYPTMVVELGSHTDCRGTIQQNATLSDNRAKASAEYIKKKISNPDRIYGKGYGESKLKSDCPCEGTVKSTCTEEQHQENRRTEFLIIKI